MGTEYTPMDIYRYLIPDLRLKLARFQSVKNKASSKRLLYVVSPSLPQSASIAVAGHLNDTKRHDDDGIGVETLQNY